MSFLRLPFYIILDEIHRLPGLFYLLKQSSESLAGRIAYKDLSGFTLTEVNQEIDQVTKTMVNQKIAIAHFIERFSFRLP
jgi:predicted AAA+ superfamily ATPase